MLHPRFSVLVRYASDELSPRRRKRVKSHLADCTRCRKELTAIRVVKEKTATAYRTTPPPRVLEEVLEHYAAGERIILPVADPPAERTGRHRMLGAAAAVLFLVGAAAVFGIRGARAGHSELIFEPAHPKRGDTVQVEYRATSWLGAEEKLVLRARYRRPQDPQYNRGMRQLVVTELEKVKAGVYRSSLVLPDSVVYAVFAVEDTAAERVDSNGRRLWEVMAHRDTVPEYESLVQKRHDLMGRNWEAAFATARQAVHYHPARVGAWESLSYFETAVAGPVAPEPLKAQHKSTMIRFDNLYRDQDGLDGDQLGSLYWYALRSWSDSATIEFWRSRLLMEAPTHPLAVQELTLDLVRLHRGDAAAALEAYEQLWQQYGPAHPQLPLQAYLAARRVGDTGALRLWAERRELTDPRLAIEHGQTFLGYPELHQDALSRFRQQLLLLDTVSDGDRSLLSTGREQWQKTSARRTQIQVLFGNGLLQVGNVPDGLAMLTGAVSVGWDLDAFRSLAEARLIVGDVDGALEMMAFLAADVRTDSTTLDWVETVVHAESLEDRWSARVGGARQEMVSRVMNMATTRYIDASAVMMDVDSNPRRLADVVRAVVTVVAFWSRHSAPSLSQLQALEELSTALDARGALLIAITPETSVPEVREFLEQRGLTLHAFIDSRREVTQSLGSWSTPDYFVLDTSGAVRFAHTSLSELALQVHVLQERSAAAVAMSNNR